MIEIKTVYVWSSDTRTEEEELGDKLNELQGRIIQVERVSDGEYRIILEV